MTGSGPYGRAAWAYREAGWVGVLPLPPRAKTPPPIGYTGWAGIDPSGADVQAWCDGPEEGGNIALRLPPGVYGLDVDAYDGKTGGAALTAAEGNLGPLPPTWRVSARDDGVSGIRLFRAQLVPGRRWRDEPAGHGAGIEAIHAGHRYAVTWPSVHPEVGKIYRWYPPEWFTQGRAHDVPTPDELPELPDAWVEALSEPGEVATGEMASHAGTLDAVTAFPHHGETCTRVREAATRGLARLRAARDGAALHPAGRDATHELVALGHEGHSGARRALAEHFGAFTAVRLARGAEQRAAEAEWWRLVRGAVGKLSGEARSACDCALLAGEGVQFDVGEPVDDPSGGEGGAGGLVASRLLRRSGLASLPPVEPLVKNALSLRSASVVVGATGVGKTFTVLGLACAVATGTDWLGRPTMRTPVLYVVGEGAYGLDARITAWEQENGISVSDDDLAFRVKPGSLTDMGTWVELLADARELGARWTILDTFSSLAPDADETKDAAQIMRRLSDLAVALDGTATLIHHPGWSDDNRVRGGYQFEANADEVLLLKKGNAPNQLVMKRKKVKEGPDGEEISLVRKEAHGSLVVVAGSSEPFDDATGNAAMRRMLALAEVLIGTYGSEGPGGTRDEVRVIFDGRSEVAGLTTDAKRTAFGRAWTGLTNLRRIVKVGSADRYRFLSMDQLGPLDRHDGEVPVGLSVFDNNTNLWVEM